MFGHVWEVLAGAIARLISFVGWISINDPT
jgi:hypothetical protein